ncbi:MAG TPA: YdcF family protein [Nitrolancea sp.]|nr:YdcF family protein [Nitrolancea sp.]
MTARSLTRRRKSTRDYTALKRATRIVVIMAFTVVVLGVLSLLILALAILHQARKDEATPADAIVVLGAAQWNGSPSTILQARLDHAYDLYVKGYAPMIVLTGGMGVGDIYSESGVSEAYLQKRGVPENAMRTVGGRTSLQSLQEAKAEYLKNGEHIILVSDPFHMFRVKHMSEDMGLVAYTSPTLTSPIRPNTPTEYRYVAREVGAYLAYLFLKR